MIMDPLLFEITKWASLLVDIDCPQGRSLLGVSIHFYWTSCTDECVIESDKKLTLHETYDHWSVAVLTVTMHFTYFHF